MPAENAEPPRPYQGRHPTALILLQAFMRALLLPNNSNFLYRVVASDTA